MRVIVDFISWFTRMRFRLRQAVVMWLHTDLKRPIANGLVYFGILVRTLRLRKAGLKLILKGRRVDNVARANKILRNIIHQEGKTKSEFLELLGKDASRPIEEWTSWRLLILKLPRVNNSEVIEKGVVIVKFSETFAPIFLSLDVRLLAKYFHIVLEPSSAGYSTEEILIWTMLNPEKVVVFSPYLDDSKFLQNLNTNLVPVSQGAADWVNPFVFHKIDNTEKIYDAIYVANFNPVKRVDRFIRAITRITRSQPDFRAALVCAGHGGVRREIMAMLDWAKTRANISFFDGMDQARLNVLFNQSKVNVLLSLREGANKGLAEGLFSGTPAILLAENIGVNRANINIHTGKIIPDSKLEDTLLWFSHNYLKFTPQQWAETHISPTVSTENLSQTLKENEESEGRVWTKDLFPKVNQPELAYLHPEHSWLLNERAELLKSFSNGADEKIVNSFLGRLSKIDSTNHGSDY